MFLKVCLFTYNVFVMLHSECFIGVIWPHLRQMCPFMDWIFIFHLFILVVLFIFRWLSLFICSVVFPYLVFFAVVGVLLLGIPLKDMWLTELNFLRKELHPYMTVDQGVYMISLTGCFLRRRLRISKCNSVCRRPIRLQQWNRSIQREKYIGWSSP